MVEQQKAQRAETNSAAANDAIGIVVVSHCRLAEEMIRAAELILGPMEATRAISIDSAQPVETTIERVQRAVKDVDVGRGVLILTDLFGGTPANISLPLAGPGVEVICGMNLPMLIKFADCRHTHSVTEAAELLQEYGRRHISLASRFLPGAGKRS